MPACPSSRRLRDASFVAPLPIYRVLEEPDPVWPRTRMVAEAAGERGRDRVGASGLRDVGAFRGQSRGLGQPGTPEGDMAEPVAVPVSQPPHAPLPLTTL